MDNLFKGLEDLGISDMSDIQLFDKPEDKEEKVKVIRKTNVAEDVVYQRKVTCPVCGKIFLTSSVRVGRIRFVDTELDLKPIYNDFDPIPYDVVICSHCGYGGLNKYFNRVSEFKAKSIKQIITANYKGKDYPLIYKYEHAVERYKLALLNSTIGHDNNGMKAYLCLKLSWLYRSWIQEIKETDDEKDVESQIKLQKLSEAQHSFIKNAYEGFLIAYETEDFPIMGIDQGSLEYLIAELARQLSLYDESRKWLSRVIQRKNVNKRLYNKIQDMKELLNKSRGQ